MAACVISDLATTSACVSNGAMTRHQQMLIKAYYYWELGLAIAATMPATATAFTEFAKCWQVLTDDQVLAYELVALQNAITAVGGSPSSFSTAYGALKCLEPLDERTLQRIIAALQCSAFGSLPAL